MDQYGLYVGYFGVASGSDGGPDELLRYCATIYFIYFRGLYI